MNRMVPSWRLAALLIMSLSVCSPAIAGDDMDPEEPLGDVPVPLPSNINNFVKDHEAAIRLGKALFWDEQVGSDGRVACATCHFQAGVDVRTVNTVNPGPNGVIDVTLPLDPSDFPFTHDDIVGSGGVIPADFVSLVPDSSVEDCVTLVDPTDDSARQVTGRNAASTIGAIFYEEGFWDGRAKRRFNGIDGDGGRKRVWRLKNGELTLKKVGLSPASTASQAVGPPLSDVEMTCAGRTFPVIGTKLIQNGLMPLALQEVSPTDSVLGAYANPTGGLTISYSEMIDAAFKSKWASNKIVPDGSGRTQKEANFSLLWGIAILMYESTLVPDDTPFDRNELTPFERDGLEVYNDQGRCAPCHGGPESSVATISQGGDSRAFTNTAVRPIAEDPGRGDGEFKSVTVRNIEFTGPYFHTGGYLTLRQVVDFYDRGGDFPNDETDSQVRELNLTEYEKDALVAFMLALTDERVEYSRAPFDHPSLNPPNHAPIPAVGAAGVPEGQQLRPFLDIDHFQP